MSLGIQSLRFYIRIILLSLILINLSTGKILSAIWVQDTDVDFRTDQSTSVVIQNGKVTIDTNTITTFGISSLSQGGNGLWLYRQKIALNNSTGKKLTDLPVEVRLSTAVFNYARCSPDGSDLRVTDTDGVTELPFWLSKWDATSESIFWVKVSTIPAKSIKSLYLYYGNSSASSVTVSPGQIFDLYDEFTDITLNSSWQNLPPYNYIWEQNGTYAGYGELDLTVSQFPGFLTFTGVRTGNLVTEDNISVGWIGRGLRSSLNLDLTYPAYLIESEVEISELNGNAGIGVGLEYNKDNRFNVAYFISPAAGTGLHYLEEYQGTFQAKLLSSRAMPVIPEKVKLNVLYTSSNVTFMIDGSSATQYTNLLTSATPVFFAFSLGYANRLTAKYDWIRIRKYSVPFPTVDYTGSEEDLRASGVYISPVYDAQVSASWERINWYPAISTGDIEIRCQIATSNDGIPTSFRGPDGTNRTWYDINSGPTIWPGHSPARYIQYRCILSTTDRTKLPELDKVEIRFTRQKFSGSDNRVSFDELNVNLTTGTFIVSQPVQLDTSIPARTAIEDIKGNQQLKLIDPVGYQLNFYTETGTPPLSETTQTVKVYWRYNDVNSDGFVDGMKIKPEFITIFKLDPTRWLPVNSVHLEPENQRVSFSISNSGTYAMFANEPTSELLTELFNFPNPFTPGKQDTTITYHLAQDANLTLRIYLPSGELVYTREYAVDTLPAKKTVPGSVNKLSWDGRNNVGMVVANGIYICDLTARPVDGSSTARQIRKIAVLK